MEKKREENNSGNSGHYVVASRPPNGDQLQYMLHSLSACAHIENFVGGRDNILS